MLARDLASAVPMVALDTDASEAARIMARRRLPGLIVAGSDEQPYTVLPGSQVLRLIIPGYVRDDPALARSIDPATADQLCRALTGSTVRDLLPPKRHVSELPVVEEDATSLEVAATMARTHSPLVAVVSSGRYIGAVTVSRLLDHLLPSDPEDPADA